MNNDKYNFDDITPLPISDEAPETQHVLLCKIMYTPEFETVFSYLRALMAKDELSERAMYVACCAISLVPAHYTVWRYKYRIVEKLVEEGVYDADDELKWCAELAINNEKNYQIWQYRELIIELKIRYDLGQDRRKYCLEDEYDIIHQMLDSDEKNYHVWSHKRWLVSYFGLFQDVRELDYTKELIEKDVRNNSAWNFRHFLIFGTDEDSTVEDEWILREINFTKHYIESSITNPSSWNYMKFLYSTCNKKQLIDGLSQIKALADRYSCNGDFNGDLDTAVKEKRLSVPAVELLSDIYKDEGKVEQQKNVYNLLGTELDPVRKNYWAYKISLC